MPLMESKRLYANALDHQRAYEQSILPDASDESRVLVISLGGTIGMLATPNGLDTLPGFLEDLLSSMHLFNDPTGESIIAHSHSRAAYRSWSASRNPSPTRSAKTSGRGSPNPRLDVFERHTRDTVTAFRSSGPVQLPTLVTPQSHSGKRIRYAILEHMPVIDSSNMTSENWLELAADIERNYQYFDAFVILSGTDTLAYTSSILSFLLENLGKSVVITGAQIPLSALRNDAFENLLGALLLAGLFVIAEVTVFFHQKLFRGNRVVKQSAIDFDAFTSPNLDPLAQYGIDLRVDWSLICRPTAIAPFRAHRTLCTDVGHLRFIPTMNDRVLRAALADVRGLVLETYGNGNALERPGWQAIVKEATDRGVVIVNITQCHRGSVKPSYAAGAWLNQAGVVSGLDMTTEAALAKLMYLLSKPALQPDHVRALMSRPLRGELTCEPPYVLVDSIDGGDVARGVESREVQVDAVGDFTRMYGSLMPELAPSTSAEMLNQFSRLTLPRQLVQLAMSGPAASLATLLASTPHADPDGSGSLHAATLAGRADCVRVLLARGASVHARHDVAKLPSAGSLHAELAGLVTPLACAARGSEVEGILLSAGAHPIGGTWKSTT